MNNTPIYSRLLRHKSFGRSSFHTPGHKCSDFLPDNLFKLDCTELPDTDALYEANGIILETEKNLSALFGTKRTLISSGGCTLAIQTMLCLALKFGRKMLFSRNVHRSAVNAMALLGIDPVWVLPHSDTDLFTGRISPSDIETALDADKEITAVYLTSPDYYGELCDIGAIAEICHSHGAILMVDNAHGSHLAFGSKNLHPIHLGADMTACSLHKTLPVLTGGAVLNINNKDLAENSKEAMSLFGSTSPSYPVMSSIDICCDYLLNGNGKSDYTALETRVAHIKSTALKKGLTMPDGLCDPLRVCINTSLAGIKGEEQEKYFCSYNIDCEFCDGENAVFICTPFNTERDFIRLETAIKNLPDVTGKKTVRNKRSLPKKIFPPRKALFSHSESVNIKDAVGRTASSTVCPCPPGIPVIMPGEVIDETTVSELLKLNIKTVNCIK